eukprot:m.64503 g.64503  ORF g.64503 m.64503 type:complete len:769 (-) comp9723_c0_seq2:4150-6456(-)
MAWLAATAMVWVAGISGRSLPAGYAVRFVGEDHRSKAVRAASDLGMVNHGQIGMIEGVYRFDPSPRGRRDDEAETVDAHNLVEQWFPLTPKTRVRRFQPSDPLFGSQWYLGSPSENGLWQQSAWDHGFNGSGVVVTVVDDGLEWDHPDLLSNYDPNASHNFNARKTTDPHRNDVSDPYPDRSDTINKHGTRCAGAVAAGASNGVCGSGVAFGANIGGVRMLDGPVDDAVEAGSLSWNSQHVDIYSCSWGPDDDGSTFDGPGELTTTILRKGALEGREGLGSIFVWAAGNGGYNDNCGCDGYVNSVYTIAVNAVNRDGGKPGYTERCAGVFISVTPGVITTDLFGRCTQTFSGTSAAAPIAAGAIAIVLQANPCLTWRDVQHITARSATPHGSDIRWNSAGLPHSPTFGFGILNVTKMVELAAQWTPVGAPVQLSIGPEGPPPSAWPTILLTIDVTGCDAHGEGVCIDHLEHVSFRVSFETSGDRGGLTITATSPTNTLVNLLGTRGGDHHQNVDLDWTFLSVGFWGESPAGRWTITLMANNGGNVKVKDWTLILRGTVDYSTDARSGGGARAQPSPSLPNRTLQNSCTTCPQLTFADGAGGCRPCHPSCIEGCVAPGQSFCIQEDTDDVAGHGSSHSHLGEWFMGSHRNELQKILLSVLGVTLVVGFVLSLRRTLRKPDVRSRSALDEGRVSLLANDNDPEEDDIAVEMTSIAVPDPDNPPVSSSGISPDAVCEESPQMDPHSVGLASEGNLLIGPVSPPTAIATTAL